MSRVCTATMTDPLKLSRRLAIRLLQDAQGAGGQRICGLIGGRDGLPVTPYPLRNAAADPSRDLQPDEAEQERVRRHMQARGERPWAFYHSLPSAPASPLALGPVGDVPFQLIISLNTKGVLDLRCWDLPEGKPRERILQIEERS